MSNYKEIIKVDELDEEHEQADGGTLHFTRISSDPRRGSIDTQKRVADYPKS